MQQENAPKKPRQVACPNCKTLAEYSTKNPYRPFCSERCKLIDLGDWANENHRIPDKTPPDDIDQIN